MDNEVFDVIKIAMKDLKKSTPVEADKDLIKSKRRHDDLEDKRDLRRINDEYHGM